MKKIHKFVVYFECDDCFKDAVKNRDEVLRQVERLREAVDGLTDSTAEFYLDPVERELDDPDDEDSPPNSHRNSCIYWLSQIEDVEVREKAVRNCKTPNTGCIDIADALIYGFGWSESPEGYDFWESVALSYQRHNQ